MKLFSKILTVVLTTVGAAGTVGGVIMFAVGGAPAIKLSVPNVAERTIGVGWLNFDATAFNDISYNDWLKNARDNKDAIKTQIDTNENSIKVDEAKIAALDPNIPADAIQIALIQINIVTTKATLVTLKASLNAPGWYDLAIAGVSIMSVGIVIAALSVAMAINIENSEERKKAKRNNG